MARPRARAGPDREPPDRSDGPEPYGTIADCAGYDGYDGGRRRGGRVTVAEARVRREVVQFRRRGWL